MANIAVGIVIVASRSPAAVAVLAGPVVSVTVVSAAMPGKTAAGTVPSVVMAIMVPAIVIRSVVRAPETVAAPVPMVPGVIPGPAAVPERVAPAPAIPGIVPPGVIPGIGVTPGGIPAISIAGTPPGVVPGVVPAIVVYINGVAGSFRLIEPGQPGFIGLTVFQLIYINSISVGLLCSPVLAVADDGHARPFGTAVDAVVINRRIIAGRAAGCEPERCEER